MKKSFYFVISFICIFIIVVMNLDTKVVGTDITAFEVVDNGSYYLYKSSSDGPKYGSDPRFDYVYEVDMDGNVEVNKYDDLDFSIRDTRQLDLNNYIGWDYYVGYIPNLRYIFDINDNKIVKESVDVENLDPLVSPAKEVVSVSDFYISHDLISDGASSEFSYMDKEFNKVSSVVLEGVANGSLVTFGDKIFFIPVYTNYIYEVLIDENQLNLSAPIANDIVGSQRFVVDYITPFSSIMVTSDDSYHIDYINEQLVFEEVSLPDVTEGNFYIYGNKYDDNNVVFYEYNDSYILEKIYDYNVLERKVNNVVEIKGEKIHSLNFTFH
jgi:hypothetical protein